jgi:hypothetical protein
MLILEMLLVLLIACVIAGVVRRERGGSFLPPPGSAGEHHVRDKTGRWWRYADDGSLEEPFRRLKRK